MTAAEILGIKPGDVGSGTRTVAQIEDNIRALTEQCMSDKKNDGWLNQAFANPEKWRGTCEGYARGGADNPKSLQYELIQAQKREAATKFGFDDAALKQANAGNDNKQMIYLVAGVAVFALALFLLLG